MPRIALVDDDRNILTSVSMTLEAEGFDVETYNDGQSALDAFNAAFRTWACSTSRCRAWTAWTCLQRLRQKTKMPVIFLTSKDDEIDELMGLRMGADDYVREAVLAATAGRTHPLASCAGRRRSRRTPRARPRKAR
jgi:two-component system response regulator ChvI